MLLPRSNAGPGAGVYESCKSNADCRGGLICGCGDDDSVASDSGGSYCVPCGYYSCYD